MVSSAVSRPMSSATFRLLVVWTGIRSSRCTKTKLPPRFNFTRNLVFVIVTYYLTPILAGQNAFLQPGLPERATFKFLFAQIRRSNRVFSRVSNNFGLQIGGDRWQKFDCRKVSR